MSERTKPNEPSHNGAVQRQTELVAVRRDELSQTVAELAQRFDVKARARGAVADLRTSAGRQLSPERLLMGVVVGGSAVAAFCAVKYWRSQRFTVTETVSE